MASSAHSALCQPPSLSAHPPRRPVEWLSDLWFHSPRPGTCSFPWNGLCVHVHLANSYSYSKSQITEHLQKWDKQDHLTHPHTLPELKGRVGRGAPLPGALWKALKTLTKADGLGVAVHTQQKLGPREVHSLDLGHPTGRQQPDPKPQ